MNALGVIRKREPLLRVQTANALPGRALLPVSNFLRFNANEIFGMDRARKIQEGRSSYNGAILAKRLSPPFHNPYAMRMLKCGYDISVAAGTAPSTHLGLLAWISQADRGWHRQTRAETPRAQRPDDSP